MPHVSRQRLEKKVLDELYKTLLSEITVKGSSRKRALLCSELFTKTEHVMLAKRLAVIYLLGEGHTFEKIQDLLKVSPSTIGRIWLAMQHGAYQHTTSIVRKEKTSDILGAILNVLFTGPPSRTAPRWRFLDDL
jgi:uncharacterized protein YerC